MRSTVSKQSMKSEKPQAKKTKPYHSRKASASHENDGEVKKAGPLNQKSDSFNNVKVNAPAKKEVKTASNKIFERKAAV